MATGAVKTRPASRTLPLLLCLSLSLSLSPSLPPYVSFCLCLTLRTDLLKEGAMDGEGSGEKAAGVAHSDLTSSSALSAPDHEADAAACCLADEAACGICVGALGR